MRVQPKEYCMCPVTNSVKKPDTTLFYITRQSLSQKTLSHIVVSQQSLSKVNYLFFGEDVCQGLTDSLLYVKCMNSNQRVKWLTSLFLTKIKLHAKEN